MPKAMERPGHGDLPAKILVAHENRENQRSDVKLNLMRDWMTDPLWNPLQPAAKNLMIPLASIYSTTITVDSVVRILWMSSASTALSEIQPRESLESLRFAEEWIDIWFPILRKKSPYGLSGL